MAQALIIVGTIVGIAGTMQAAKQQAQMHQYNAEAARQEAEYRKQAAAAEVEDHRHRVAKMQGKNRAIYGKSGVLMEGTPLEVMQENEMESLLDEKRIIHTGEYQANRAEQEAVMEGMRAKYAKTEGIARSASLLASGAASYASVTS